ncbi:polysaccharide lyase family 1 protein [Prosthecobacter sp.]|uniref:polysaccharide lyase family 1 protein n=1 Tax=Prosthecobacter sp. TaxID=1965333 RepID=UPI003784F0C3
MNAASPDRQGRSIRLLLALPLLLWLFVLLHVLRVSTGFNWLVKHLTPYVVFGVMTLCPLAAAWQGWRMLRQRSSLLLGRVALYGGSFLFVGFIIYPGIPLVRKWTTPKTAKNPGQPSALPPLQGLPVFPGAEGFGTRTPAGRGGKVIEVTTLADHGPGSLREALNDPAPRTVVFRVGGTIELETPIIVMHPFFTLAGQTAPGDGICLKNAGMTIATHDVLIQHLRIRPGNEGRSMEPDDNDALSILGTHGKVTDGAHHVVLDHVSAGWSEDEAVSTWFGAHDITFSWCIVSEALDQSRHHKGHHSAGLLIGDGCDHVTVHHTLMAHNGFRNPLISAGGTHDIVNNVVYDPGNLAGEVFDTDSNSFVNFVGNFFKPGRSTEPGLYEIIVNASGTPKIFVEGNRGPHRAQNSSDDWSLVSYKFDQKIAPTHYRAAQRYATWPVTATDADSAYAAVLAQAGATQPKRDAADARIVSDVKNGTGSMINSPAEVGGHPKLAGGAAPADTDHDGMPDAWEQAHGLDSQNAADGKADAGNDGYTNLEEYLHSLSAQLGP